MIAQELECMRCRPEKMGWMSTKWLDIGETWRQNEWGCFAPPYFSPSQYLSIVFSSSQSVISGQCSRSLQMSLGVFAHLWECYLLNSMVTVWQLVSKYSQVVCCVMGAREFPVAVFTPMSLCPSKDFSYSFWHWPFLSSCLFPLAPYKAATGKCINGIVKAKERQQLILHCT